MAQTKQKRFIVTDIILSVLVVAIIYTIYNNANERQGGSSRCWR